MAFYVYNEHRLNYPKPYYSCKSEMVPDDFKITTGLIVYVLFIFWSGVVVIKTSREEPEVSDDLMILSPDF